MDNNTLNTDITTHQTYEDQSTYSELFFIRHGERADQARHLKIEWEIKEDPPLTPLGLIQAYETGVFFKHYMINHKFDEVILESSPFVRTL